MGKLHELLAVESSLEGSAAKIMKETIKAFEKGFLFRGKIKTLEMFAEDDRVSNGVVERLDLTTTVEERLDFMKGFIADFFDAVFQKDCANQKATADIIIGDFTIATNVPATFLLSMEKKLKTLRPIFELIPTLEQGVKWEDAPDQGGGISVTAEPKVSFKTKKTKKWVEVSKATKEHKAQVQFWDDTENCGKYIETFSSGEVTPARKSLFIKNLDNLINAVKEARQRANCVEVPAVRIGNDLMKYLLNQ